MKPLTRITSFSWRLAVVTLALCSAPTASAQVGAMNCLLGSSATMDVRFPNVGNIISVHPASPTVVSGAIEFPPYVGANGSSFPWQVDVADMSLNIQHLGAFNALGGAAFNGFVFSFAGLSNPISSVTVNGTSTLTPFQVTFNASQIFVNYQGLGVIGPSVTNLDVHCVPEPASAGLAAIALTATALRRTRKASEAKS
jgi:hypothetical protein